MVALKWYLKYLRREFLALPGRSIMIVILLIMLLLPVFVQDSYVLRIFALASIFAIFAASWDLLSGFVGQISLGHALFFGVASYTSALLNLNFEISHWITIPLGALMAVVAGIIVGFPSLRLKGPYLALVTLAFPIMLLGLIYLIPGITGGELGISGITRLASSRIQEYYITFFLMLLLCYGMWKITESKIGLIFHAIREDEIAVRTAGINTARYKLFAFCLSGFFAGLAGGLYAHFIRIAGPGSLEIIMSLQAVIWVIFGGIATIYGAVLGVFILYPLVEFMRVVPEYRMIGFALIVIIVLRFMPEGITTWVRRKIEKECPRCKVRNSFNRKECRVCFTDL